MTPKPFILSLLFLAGVLQAAEESTKDSTMMRAAAIEAGRMSPDERKLFEESIRSTKRSITYETLEVFYRDALDYYRQGRYDLSLEWLEKIYSIDPYYKDVSVLRETISRMKDSSDIESKRRILEDYMRKGNAAQQAGKNVEAIAFWKQALTVNPSYEPAKKKVRLANRAMAQKQYEAGYLYYHHGDMAEALDSWSNAIALDPHFKKKGLLALMSKAELARNKDRVNKLADEAAKQFANNDLPGALQSYEELLKLNPRNTGARQKAARIKVLLGKSAFNSAQESRKQGMYAQSIRHYQEAIRYEYEVQRSNQGIDEAERMVRSEQSARNANRAAAAQKASAAKQPPAAKPRPVVAEPTPPPTPTDTEIEEANLHYRKSLAAIRSKDYHLAVEECEIAAKLNPSDEHIYIACQRAKQEWAAFSAGRSSQ